MYREEHAADCVIHEVALLEEEYPDDGSSNEGNNRGLLEE